jgi:hypothetical protein
VTPKVLGPLSIIVWSCSLCAPTTGLANIYSCSGWAEGQNGSRLNVWLSPEAVVGWDHAEWDPPHSGSGPLSLKMLYDVQGGHLSLLRKAWLDGELTDDAFASEGSGYIALSLDHPRLNWRESWRAERHAVFHFDTHTSTPLGTVIVASDRPSYPGEKTVRPERLALLGRTGSVRVTGFGRSGATFSDAKYDLSNPGERYRLFQLAYASAVHALKNGCPPADTACECGG